VQDGVSFLILLTVLVGYGSDKHYFKNDW